MYSHSRIGTFEQCPKKYQFRYVDRIKTDIEAVETFLGSCVHKALERLYRLLLNGRLLSEEELLAFYEDEWDRRWHPKVEVRNRDLQVEHYRSVGRQCLRDYYRRYRPFNRGKVVGIERRIVIALDEAGHYKLQGFVDRIDKVGDGVFEIHDYKTNATLPSQEEKDVDRQLALYEIGLREIFGSAREVHLVWHYLRFDEEIRSQRTAEQLQELRQEMLQQVRRIEAAVESGEMPAVESELCNWCEFRRICPLWRHLYETEELPAEQYQAEDGVALVNRLAVVSEERRQLSERDCELKAEKEELEKAIALYAREHGVERLFGSDHEAVVTWRRVWQVPTRSRDPLRYQQLEEVLRSSEYWQELSEISRKRLQSWLEHDGPEDLRQRLQGLVEQAEIWRVSLRERKDVPGD